MGTRIIIFATGFLMLTFGVLLAAWGAQTAYSFHWRLERGEAVRTDARVDDLRTMEDERTHAVTHQLRYAFKVRGDDATYRFDDDIWFVEQGDGWVDVPEDVWDAARDDGKLDVEYLADDPSVNQPVDAPRGLLSAIVFALLGLASAAIGAMLAFRRVRPSSPLTT